MSFRLRLDPIACDGRGVCAELLPERIDLDDWGYPIIDPTSMAGVVLEHARRAVAACPVLALRLETVKPERSHPQGSSPSRHAGSTDTDRRRADVGANGR